MRPDPIQQLHVSEQADTDRQVASAVDDYDNRTGLTTNPPYPFVRLHGPKRLLRYGAAALALGLGAALAGSFWRSFSPLPAHSGQ